MAEEEARRLGEKPDAELPSDQELTLEQAEANVREALPIHSGVTYVQTETGEWLNTRTGEVTNEPQKTG